VTGSLPCREAPTPAQARWKPLSFPTREMLCESRKPGGFVLPCDTRESSQPCFPAALRSPAHLARKNPFFCLPSRPGTGSPLSPSQSSGLPENGQTASHCPEHRGRVAPRGVRAGPGPLRVALGLRDIAEVCGVGMLLSRGAHSRYQCTCLACCSFVRVTAGQGERSFICWFAVKRQLGKPFPRIYSLLCPFPWYSQSMQSQLLQALIFNM